MFRFIGTEKFFSNSTHTLKENPAEYNAIILKNFSQYNPIILSPDNFATKFKPMLDFNHSPNTLLDDFETIYEASYESEFQEIRLQNCSEALERAAGFFKCSRQQALLLALLVTRNFLNEENTVKELLDYLGLKPSQAMHINMLLKEFVEKDWVKPTEDIRYTPFTAYQLSKPFIQFVVTGSWKATRKKAIRSSFDLLDRFGNLIAKRSNGNQNYHDFKKEVNKLIGRHQKQAVCKFIRDNKLTELDALLLLSYCYFFYVGEEETSIDYMFNRINPGNEEMFFIRQQFKRRQGKLFSLELITAEEGKGHFLGIEYRLTDDAIRAFISKDYIPIQEVDSAYLQAIFPQSIHGRKLFYDEMVQQQINRVENLLTGDNFNLFTERMKAKGMKPGLTIILYGQSGTGKTETVYQLAKKSGRTVLLVNVSSLKSKWVGDNEKNIKKLFTEYREMTKNAATTPILLFNEADAIFGKRQEGGDRIDKMENAVQNILLQELEDFEGIFIATTNLESNLDTCFDRRILYKVKYGEPSAEMRAAIWREKFPQLTEDLIHRISKEFKLTGGNINNILKKVEVDYLLDQDHQITESYLFQLAKEEIMMRSKEARPAVGFIQR